MATVNIAGLRLKRSVLILILLLFATVAFFVFVSLTEPAVPVETAEPKPKAPVVITEEEILISNRPLNAGDAVELEALAWTRVPSNETRAGDIIRSQTPDAVSKLSSMRVKSAISRGTRIYWNLFEDVPSSALAHKITPGMRAVTIEVATTGSVGGYIAPGDKVDLYHVVRSGIATGVGDQLSQSIIVAQNVRVLAADEAWHDVVRFEEFDTRRFLTVELNPRLATLVSSLAERIGALQVVMRNPFDDDEAEETLLADGNEFIQNALGNQEVETGIVRVFLGGVAVDFDCSAECLTDQASSHALGQLGGSRRAGRAGASVSTGADTSSTGEMVSDFGQVMRVMEGLASYADGIAEN